MPAGWQTSEDAHPQCPLSSSDVQRENKIRDHEVRSSCGMGTESAGGIAVDMPGETSIEQAPGGVKKTKDKRQWC